MSGGSYEYLFVKDADELMRREASLEQMADRLAGMGDAQDAANETRRLVENIRVYRSRIEVAAGRMSEVWKAVEWMDSGDWSEDQVRAALEKYRGQA